MQVTTLPTHDLSTTGMCNKRLQAIVHEYVLWIKIELSAYNFHDITQKKCSLMNF